MERRRNDRRLHATERLTTRLLLRVSAWAIGLVIFGSIVTFYVVYQNAQHQFMRDLNRDVAQKIERNQRFFERIEAFGDVLAERFVQRYEFYNDTNSLRYEQAVDAFDAWYEETSPGVLRLPVTFHSGTTIDNTRFEYLSAFVGPRPQPMTSELKLRSTVALSILNELGPAWQHVVTNTHFSMPENILMLYSPDQPWGLLADKDLVITNYSVVKSTLQSENPERKPNWTGLYYDITAGYWTITYQRPIDYAGKHLANASFDVGISQLLADLTQRQRPDAEHFVLNSRGQLISATNIAFDLVQEQALLTPETYPDPAFLSINAKILSGELSADTSTLDDFFEDHVVTFQRIDNPNWWYVTIYPKLNIQREAAVLPVRLIVGGVALVLLVLMVVYLLVRREVSKPLTEMAHVASMMDARNYKDVLSGDTLKGKLKGEVRYALNAFVTMAKRFIKAQEQLEEKVEQRTRELARANKMLEALANMDGLTGLMNRRAFDRDLAQALQPDSEPSLLVLGDLDSFKAYNDNYGHEAGDQALQKIAQYLMNACEQTNVYRYGGEELAIILPQRFITEQPEYIDNLRSGITQLGIEHNHSASGIGALSISFGVAPIKPGQSASDVIRMADTQLYLAKRRGGNRTVMAEELLKE